MAQRQTNKSDDADISTVVSPGMRIVGRIHGGEDIRVQGTIEGSVMLSSGSLHVDAGGVVLADVQAESVYISGIVVGDLTAQNRVVLRDGARVVGDISTRRLVIEAGAAIRGGVATSEEAQDVAEDAAAEVEDVVEDKKSVSRANGARNSAKPAARDVKPVLKAPPQRKSKKATKATKDAIRAKSAKTPSKSSKKKVARPRVPARGKHRAARS